MTATADGSCPSLVGIIIIQENSELRSQITEKTDNLQAGMSYAQPQAEAVSLNSWLVFPPFGTLNRM